MASETCAFDLLGAEYVRDIEPGEMLRISQQRHRIAPLRRRKSRCSTAFSSTSISRGPTAWSSAAPWISSREMLGRLLAREHPADADVVVPVPDSGVPAAIGYSLESGVPFRMGLIRNHYVGRTFIEPEQAIRDFGVKLKLNPVRALLEGKRVVLVDDSIVRGTTSRKIVRMVREAGATEVHMRISCPPTISPCYYGIDTPTREELLAADASRIRPRLPEANAAESFGSRRARSKKFAGSSTPIRWAIFRSKACARPSDDDDGSFCTSCYTGVLSPENVQLEVASRPCPASRRVDEPRSRTCPERSGRPNAPSQRTLAVSAPSKSDRSVKPRRSANCSPGCGWRWRSCSSPARWCRPA